MSTIDDELFAKAVSVLGSEKLAHNWLENPKRALGGQIPLTLAETESGALEVMQLLGRIEHGVFS